MARKKIYSEYAKEANLLLGQQIKLARLERKWTLASLAERAGISEKTLQHIEAGKMTTSIGSVFETASLVGVALFEQDNQRLSGSIDLMKSRIALLPKRIKPQVRHVDDDF